MREQAAVRGTCLVPGIAKSQIGAIVRPPSEPENQMAERTELSAVASQAPKPAH
jgi:hypothetical protein